MRSESDGTHEVVDLAIAFPVDDPTRLARDQRTHPRLYAGFAAAELRKGERVPTGAREVTGNIMGTTTMVIDPGQSQRRRTELGAVGGGMTPPT